MAKYNLGQAKMLKALDDFWSEEDLAKAIENLITAGKCKDMNNKDIETGDLIIPKKYCLDENDNWFTPENYPEDKLGKPEFFTVVDFEGGYGIVDLKESSLIDSYDYRSDNGASLGGWYSTEDIAQVAFNDVFGENNYVIIKKHDIDKYIFAMIYNLHK